jgi:hypothetical protein
MTPKEKAQELVDGFKNIDIEYNDSIEGNCFMTMTKSDAKQCALIAVDELLEVTKRYDYTLSSNPIYNQYWLNVKSQIELL